MILNERSVTSLRKAAFWLVLAMLLAVCAVALADTEYSLAPCPGSVTLRDNKIILTRTNLDDHADYLAKLGTSKESLLEDWEARGVVLQAWLEETKRNTRTCLEISVNADDEARRYYDVVNTKDRRRDYLNEVKSSPAYADAGYFFTEKVDWHQYKNKNYALRMTYKRTTDAGVYWGHMIKTVARGYTVVLDYRVYDRGLSSGDYGDLARAVNTLVFTDAVGEIPAAPAASADPSAPTDSPAAAATAAFLQVTAEPPAETNSDTFYVEGRTVPGAKLIGVLMRINSATPLKFYTDANVKTGSFRMKVTIPEENVWLMTLNVEVNDKIVTEKVFSTTVYKKTLIPVAFDAPFPEAITADETVLSGTTERGVTVQCIVTNGTTTFDKTVRPNGTGRFSFKIPTSVEAEYDVAVVFSKRNFDTSRFTFRGTRNLTQDEHIARMKSQALRPGYNVLLKSLDQYIGKTLGYSLWVTDIRDTGNEWIVTTAGTKNGDDYRNFIIFMAAEEPSFAVGEQHFFYGSCIGSYQIQSEEGTESYPACDLIYAE